MHPGLSGSGVGVTPHAARQQHSNNMALQLAVAAVGFGSVPFGGRPSQKSKRPLHFLTRLILPSFNDCSSPLEDGDNAGILYLNCIKWSLRRTGAMAGRRNKEVIWRVAKYGLVPLMSPQRQPGPHAADCDWQIIGSPVFHCRGRHNNLYVMVPRYTRYDSLQ